MSYLATIAIDAEAFDLGEVLHTGEERRIDLTQFVPMDGHLAPYFWVDGDDTEAFEATVRDDPRVDELVSFDGAVGRTLYHIQWTDEIDGFLSALETHDVLVERASGSNSTWIFELRSETKKTLSAFQQACIDEGITITVRSVTADPEDAGAFPFDLTEKQREAIDLALERGYFEVPRHASLTELADEVGISRQAFSRRLNRGLQRLLTDALDHPSSGLRHPPWSGSDHSD